MSTRAELRERINHYREELATKEARLREWEIQESILRAFLDECISHASSFSGVLAARAARMERAEGLADYAHTAEDYVSVMRELLEGDSRVRVNSKITTLLSEVEQQWNSISFFINVLEKDVRRTRSTLDDLRYRYTHMRVEEK